MKKVLSRILALLVTVFLSVVFSAGMTWADDDAQDEAVLWAEVAEDIAEAPGYEDPKDNSREWAFSIGLISGVSPDYEGSNDYSFGYGPNISLSWRDTIFYKGKTLSANLIREKNFKAGPILSFSSGRDEDDNDKLEGLGDVDGSTEVGGFVSYRKKPWRFRAEVLQDIDSGHEGALVKLTGGTTLPFGKPLVFLGIGTTWASDDYMESFFGVNGQQSANSGLERHQADAGIKDISVSMTAGYAITKRWRIGGAIEYKRLLGDAADSPIVDDKNQYLAGITLSYHVGLMILPDDIQ
ncbi:MAG: MipA/OmpV family protein [Desulfuromusa sp.]|nr:MipA/OmpV family protein [Desulfuromusa sp.]